MKKIDSICTRGGAVVRFFSGKKLPHTGDDGFLQMIFFLRE
ncbi:MAG: hypothetical protein WCR02_05035 [Sphaerochaetaceae bacterium]